jgi:hypothetical protein
VGLIGSRRSVFRAASDGRTASRRQSSFSITAGQANYFWWAGAGSNRRPSDFQPTRRCTVVRALTCTDAVFFAVSWGSWARNGRGFAVTAGLGRGRSDNQRLTAGAPVAGLSPRGVDQWRDRPSQQRVGALLRVAAHHGRQAQIGDRQPNARAERVQRRRAAQRVGEPVTAPLRTDNE